VGVMMFGEGLMCFIAYAMLARLADIDTQVRNLVSAKLVDDKDSPIFPEKIGSCPNCGYSRVPKFAKFCTACGTSLS